MPNLFPGVAVVTGAGGKGIGNAIAVAFAREGCLRIAITDIDADSLAVTIAEINTVSPQATVLAEVGNVANAVDVERFYHKIRSEFGRIDYAVNNAGILGTPTDTLEMSIENFDKVNSVNYRGLWLCERQELAIMREQQFLTDSRRRQRGSIVNIASQLGLVGRREAPAYVASKTAILGLTRADAIDQAQYGIRINSLCPGIVQTRMNVRPGFLPSAQYDWLAPELESQPLSRMAMPDEIADVCLFLSSEKASFVIGAAWVVDGGYSIH